MTARTRGIAAAALAAAILLAGAVVWLAAVKKADIPEPSARLLQAAEGLDEIAIEAELNVERRVLNVHQTMTLTNRTGQTLSQLVLRTWPNAFQSVDTSPCAADEELYGAFYPDGFSAGALIMAQASAAGQHVVYRYTDDAKTVLELPVSNGWNAGETLAVELHYAVQIPRMAYRFGFWDGIYALGNAFAIPAVWEDGQWRTDAYAPVGDPFVSDCANYAVAVTVPQGYTCAGSGWPEVEEAGEKCIFRFDSPAVRDFALVISDSFRMVQSMENGVLITAYAADAKQAREMVRSAEQAVQCYANLYGAYPYQSYTLAQIHFPMGGMEYPALSMIAADKLNAGGRELEYLVAHETAHQWWYAAVGSDGWYQSWQDEALASFSVLEYAKTVHGAGERAELERSGPQSAMRVTVPQGVTPGAPLDVFTDFDEYEQVVYDRGTAWLCALDEMLAGGLSEALADYYEAFAFRRATRMDFENQLALSTGEDFAPLTRDYLDTHILN